MRRLQQLDEKYGAYHRDAKTTGFVFGGDERAELFARLVGGPGKRVLDLGCRWGALTRAYLEGNEVVGVDVDREALAEAAKLGIETSWADVEEALPFEDASFDVVVAGELIEHLRDPDGFVAEVRRVLRPGGTFVGSVPNFFRLRNRLAMLFGRPLDHAREAAAHGPLGHHTHWTSPAHARPTGGDPAARVREEAEWMRGQGLAPTLFCGGGWYMDEDVAETVAALGYTDCTARGLGPCRVRLASGALLPELPTTHSIGALLRRRLGPYVHAYFHDYDLLDGKRRLALVAGLARLRRRDRLSGSEPLSGPELSFSEAFGR